MKKIKKGGNENEAASFYTADEFFLRKGYQIPDLVTEVRKEAYVSGFNRGQEQAYYGFWNKDCQKLKRRGRLRSTSIVGRHTMNGRSISPGRVLILQHLPTRSIWAEKAAWTMRWMPLLPYCARSS